MSCPSYRDSIVLLVDGELSDDAASGVRAHLAGCEECRAIATELERLAALLRPGEGGSNVTPMDESRFWRRFDADLAVRMARGETPWWRRSIPLPVPAMGAVVAVVVVTGWIAGRQHRHAVEMEARAQHLQAVLRQVAESAVFPVAETRFEDATPVRTADLGSGATAPAAEIGARAAAASASAPVFAPRVIDAMPASFTSGGPAPSRAQPMKARTSIHFVDSDGMLKPEDLY